MRSGTQRKEYSKQVNSGNMQRLDSIKSGSVGLGIFLILSQIPFIGFIFMFLVSSNSGKIGRGLNMQSYILSKPARRLSFFAIITAIAMFLGAISYVSLFPTSAQQIALRNLPPGFTDFSSLTLLWYPLFLTVLVGTLMSNSKGAISYVGLFLGFIFLLFFTYYVSNQASFNVLNYYISFTEILIAFMFIANYYSLGSNKGEMVDNVEVNKNQQSFVNSMDAVNAKSNSGYKPQFEKTVQEGQVKNVNPAENRAGYSQSNYVPSKYEQRDAIAIIGPPGAGKTTFLAYFFHFLRDIENSIGIEADVSSGLELMEEYINRIFSEHKFPELTARDRVGEVVFKFMKKKRFGSRGIMLRINDIAGETSNSLQGGPDQVRRLIVGTRFEYLLRAKGYIVMIDCSSYKEWATRDLQYRRIIETILNARLEKKTKPKISFLFTKTDTLPNAVYNYSPIELLKMLRNTYAYITKNIRNPYAFKLFIKTERDNSGNIVPKLDSGVGGMYEIKYDPNLNSGFMLVANWICEVGEL